MATAPLVLASRSPQRAALLAQLGIDFVAQAADVDELAAGDPRELALANALAKARAVAGERVLGADTIVALDGRSYGKPQDADQAATMLRDLSGRTHVVWSAIALVEERRERSRAVATEVTFRELARAEVDWYLASGEWRERAGGYAIQGRGAALVARIAGDYTTVVGLPVPALVELAPDLLAPR